MGLQPYLTRMSSSVGRGGHGERGTVGSCGQWRGRGWMGGSVAVAIAALRLTNGIGSTTPLAARWFHNDISFRRMPKTVSQ